MTYVTLTAHDGGQFQAFIAMPKAASMDTPMPAVIMIQEIFGINDEMKAKCMKKAEQGYIAIAPDLFWRQEPGISLTDKTEEEWARAFELFNGFDVDLGVKDLAATLEYLRNHEACNGKIGNVGYCLGGKLAYLLAAQTDIDASVSYYGVGLDELLDQATAIEKPLLMHIAKEDKFVPPEAQDKIVEGLAGHEHIVMYLYEGVNHAFTRLNGEHFDEAAATLANKRTDEFLKTSLR